MNPELGGQGQGNHNSENTGWESVAALADQGERLSGPDVSIGSESLSKSIEEIDATCERLFGRNRDRLARELQVVGLIDGYKRWGVEGENRAIHKEILKAVLNDQVAERKPDELNPDGTIHRMTLTLKDGRTLSEERSYDIREPVFDRDKVESYIDVINRIFLNLSSSYSGYINCSISDLIFLTSSMY